MLRLRLLGCNAEARRIGRVVEFASWLAAAGEQLLGALPAQSFASQTAMLLLWVLHFTLLACASGTSSSMALEATRPG